MKYTPAPVPSRLRDPSKYMVQCSGWSTGIRVCISIGDEVSERLQLDHVARPKVDSIGAELDRPFNDAATDFLIAVDVTEWVLSNYHYVVGVKIVMELPRCDQDGVQQLLDLGVESLRLV